MSVKITQERITEEVKYHGGMHYRKTLNYQIPLIWLSKRRVKFINQIMKYFVDSQWENPKILP